MLINSWNYLRLRATEIYKASPRFLPRRSMHARHLDGSGGAMRRRSSKRSLLLGVGLFAGCLLVMLRSLPEQAPARFYRLEDRDDIFQISTAVGDSESSEPVANMGEALPGKAAAKAPAIGPLKTVPLSSLQNWLPDAKNTQANFFTSRTNVTAPDSRYSDGKIVYLHLNKAAGSTTKGCLAQLQRTTHKSLGPILSSPGRLQLERSRSFLPDIFAGGYSFGICDLMKDKTCSYFTFLRDPYERVLSSYSYCKHAGGDQTCRGLDPWNATLKEWALHQGSYFFRQLLMKARFCTASGTSNPSFNQLDGTPHKPGMAFDRGSCWWKQKIILNKSLSRDEMETLLAHSLANLESWFSFIGLTSEYALSLAMLQRVYELPFADECASRKQSNKSNYKVIDKGGNKTEIVRLKKAELQSDPEVREALRADLLIYDKAVELFEREKTIFLANWKPTQS